MRLLTIDGKLVSVSGKAIEIPDTAGGVYQLEVSTSAGATVTATKDTASVSNTADASGQCTLTLYAAGEWTITASLNGISTSQAFVIGTQSMTLSLADPVFANNDWSAIIASCQRNQVPDTWAVGNQKSMDIGGTSYTIDIIGKNHDTYAAGGTVPLTFGLHDCYAETKAMNSSNTNSGGWKNSAMRTTHLPAILALMPTEVQNGIREVSKKTSVGGASSTIEAVSDKLFLLSEIEIFGSTSYSAAGEGTQYDYYKAGNSKVKNRSGSASRWWERSPYASDSTSFCVVYGDGNADSYGATFANGVAFGFCF